MSNPQLLFAVGIDVGATLCSVAILRPDRAIAAKPFSIANNSRGAATLIQRLTQLGCSPAAIWVGMEATGPYWENLYYALHKAGFALVLLHPLQTHQFAAQRSLRAKTDRVDAHNIALLLLSGDARPAYVPSENIASYRAVLSLLSSLSEEAARYKMRSRELLVLLFPEFTQVFKDPDGATARGLLQRYPSAAAMQAAGVDKLTALLGELAPGRYGQATAQQLVQLAAASASSGVARAARERSLVIVLQQLDGLLGHLAELERELAALLAADDEADGLGSVPEFGPRTAGVLRGELGDVQRFARVEQVVAYAGLDPRVRQSGKWRGQVKLSKRGSGQLRQLLYMAALRSIGRAGSEFGAYYRHLVAGGVAKKSALMGVMRKMLVVAYRLLKHGGSYEPSKVWAGAAKPS